MRPTTRTVAVAVAATIAVLGAAAAGVTMLGGSLPSPSPSSSSPSPSAGVTVSSSGPGCLSAVQSDEANVSVVPGIEDSGLTLHTTIAHPAGTRPVVSLTTVERGTYRLEISLVERSETDTPLLAPTDCQLGTRLDISGRLSNPVQTVEVVVGGEPIGRFPNGTWVSFPRVVNATGRGTNE